MLRSAALCGVLLLSCSGCGEKPAKASPPPGTGYSMVFLNNGQTYIGKLSGLETPLPRLEDVHYIRSVVNPETKHVSNTLVRRGGEWHGPDSMVINKTHIVFVEPVGDGSAVAKLIVDSRK